MVEAVIGEGLSPAIIASFIAAIVASLGVFTVVSNTNLALRFSPYLASLAAGMLLATAIFLFQEASHLTHHVTYWVIGGYVMLFGINLLFDAENSAGRVIAPVLAIGFHSFLDGIEYGILFNLELTEAIMASSGLILHEFAEAVVLFIILKRAGQSTLWAALWTFIGAAATTPIGAISSTYMLPLTDMELFGKLMAIAVGALLYVGTTHLIDHVRDAKKRTWAMGLYLVGITIASAVSIAHHTSAHAHEDHPIHADEHDNH